MAKEKISGIYKITSPSGKIYVGQSVDIYKRWNLYYTMNCKNQRRLYDSFLEHGVKNHNFEIIYTVYESLKQDIRIELNKMESFYVDELKSYVGYGIHGLNLKKGGDSNDLSDETKSKISLAKKGKKMSLEFRQKIAKIHTGLKRSEECKKKMRGRIGEKSPNYGKKASPETKLKMSKSSKERKRKPLSPETKEKLRLANLGKKQTQETKDRKKETRKRNRELIEEEKRMMIF